MPFVRPEPWEVWKFEKWNEQVPDAIIPLYDEFVWDTYPNLRRFMNKLTVAEMLGYDCGPMGATPKQFPVFCKPAYNFLGSGSGKICRSKSEYIQQYSAGYFYMPFFQGEHRSVDVLVFQGKIFWSVSAIGHTLTENRFHYWELVNTSSLHLQRIINFITANIPHGSGAMNFEFIGDDIIEVHFRFAAQWCEFYGDKWFESVIALYRDTRCISVSDDHTKGYSIPVWFRFVPDRMFEHPLVMDTRADECNRHNKWKRIGMINTTNLGEGLALAKQAWLWMYNNNPTW